MLINYYLWNLTVILVFVFLFTSKARDKGVSGTIVGLIFGTYSFTVFLFCPLWGVLVSTKTVQSQLLTFLYYIVKLSYWQIFIPLVGDAPMVWLMGSSPGWGHCPGVGRGYSKRFCTGRLCPEVQPLNLLYTIFDRNGTPFIYLP